MRLARFARRGLSAEAFGALRQFYGPGGEAGGEEDACFKFPAVRRAEPAPGLNDRASLAAFVRHFAADVREHGAHIVAQLETVPERTALLDEVVGAARRGGLSARVESGGEWDVVEMGVGTVHIVSGEERERLELDGLLAERAAQSEETSAEEALAQIRDSLPRDAAGDPMRHAHSGASYLL